MTTSPADKFQNPMNPVTGRSQDITFQWNQPADGTTSYEIAVYNDAAAMNKIADYTGVGNPGPFQAFLLGPFQSVLQTSTGVYFEWTPGQTYYWRVRVIVETGPIYSAWSPILSLTVQPGAALVPAILSPVNGATITDLTPSFSWSPVSGTTAYRFQLAETVSFAAPLVDAQLTDPAGGAAPTAISPAVTLVVGKTYFWRVKALLPVEGDWSAIANITVAAASACTDSASGDSAEPGSGNQPATHHDAASGS